MKKSVSVFIASLSCLLGSQAFAYSHPILTSYETLAKELIGLTETARTAEDVSIIQGKTVELIVQGVEIVKLYGEKNPACLGQFEVFLQEVPTMESQPLEQLDRRYHSGVGLPQAPKHCYFGRSQVIHPMMNLVRLKGEFTDDVREHVLDELDEVVEHLQRIEKNLNHPPN